MHIRSVARIVSPRLLLVLALLAVCPGPWGNALAYSFLRLAQFNGGAAGAFPLAGLTIDKAGNLYGTTSAGAEGSGTIFKIAPGGKPENKIHLLFPERVHRWQQPA
jgi:uncharacterized repeat protein (TIGR03803 family)